MIDFSVIIPVYNSEKYLKKCIESVRTQNYKSWEIILIDDGSTDSSGRICDEYSEIDSRVKVIHIKNGGVSNARNEGIKNAKGKRVLFLDADDCLGTDIFIELSKIIKEYDYDIICWSLKTNEKKATYFPLSEDKTFAKKGNISCLYDIRLRAFTGWSKKNIKDLSMHFIVTKLIKRDLILKNNIWFSNKIKYHEDTLFCVEILEKAESIAAINRYWYIRTLHEKSASVSFCNTINEGNTIGLKLFNVFIQNNYPEDKKYLIAYAKYQLAWFIQCMKLDILHKESGYSKSEAIRKIELILKSEVYTPKISIFNKKLKLSHIILIILLRCKMSGTIYVLLNIFNM